MVIKLGLDVVAGAGLLDAPFLSLLLEQRQEIAVIEFVGESIQRVAFAVKRAGGIVA